MEHIEERLAQMDKDIELIKKKLRKSVEERRLDLKEKFRIHDYAQGLVRWFDEIVAGLLDEENVWFATTPGDTLNMKKISIKHLKEIVYSLAKTVDSALGVTFP